jgi:hypothetical protein
LVAETSQRSQRRSGAAAQRRSGAATEFAAAVVGQVDIDVVREALGGD